MPAELSVVLPMYNEEAMAEKTVRAVSTQLEATGKSFEIVCVNDGSKDRTAEVLDAISQRQANVVSLHFSRNFGKESAIAAGLEASTGAAVILLDADLQHPPNLIPEMVELWEQGYDIVQGRKAGRGGEGVFYKAFSRLFYRIAGSSLGTEMQGASDFGLFDRQVVNQIVAMPERSRFFRGLVNWVGFNCTCVNYDVEARTEGTSSWSKFGLFKYAMHNILAFTTLPLYLTALVGAITTLLGVGLGIHTLYNWLQDDTVSGFTTVVLIIILFSGIILISIGIVAVYLAKVIDEVKARPIYIVRRDKKDNPSPSRPGRN